jgi:hypothetical protein
MVRLMDAGASPFPFRPSRHFFCSVAESSATGFERSTEADLSKLEFVCKVKSKEVTAQCICDKRQKRNLAFDVQAKAAVFDLGNRQAGLR